MKILNAITDFLSYNWLENLLIFFSLIVTSLIAYFTIKNINSTTARQIENQNKQNYRPFLNARLISFSNDQTNYVKTFELMGNRYYEAYISKGYKKVKAVNLYLLIELENYGNGMIDQLKIFDKDKEKLLINEEKKSTIDISNSSYQMVLKKDGIMQIQIKFKAAISSKQIYCVLEKRVTDFSNLLFVYKDINGNKYNTNLLIDLYYNGTPEVNYELCNNVECNKDFYDMKDIRSEINSTLERIGRRK